MDIKIATGRNDHRHAKTVWIILTAVAVVAAAVALTVALTTRDTAMLRPSATTTATTKRSPNTAATPKFPASYARAIDHYLDDTLTALDQQKEDQGNTQVPVQTRATPSYRIGADGTHEPAILRNVEDVQIPAGKYRLTAYCIGEGSADVDFTVGGASKHGLLQCSPDEVNQSNLIIDTDGTASERTVTITPSEHCESMIGYQILYYRQQ